MQVFNKFSTKEKRKYLRKRQTEAETALWHELRGKSLMGFKFFRQYSIGEYIVDFYCPQFKLAVEVDGGQHFSTDGAEYDRLRAEYMDSLDIRTVRFSNAEVLRNIGDVLSRITDELGNAPWNPPLY